MCTPRDDSTSGKPSRPSWVRGMCQHTQAPGVYVMSIIVMSVHVGRNGTVPDFARGIA